MMIAAACGSTPAFAQVRQFDVPSEDAGKSVPEFARQAQIQVIAPGNELHGVITPPLKGSYDVFVALDLMLKGTGLKVSRSADGIVTISLPEPEKQGEREMSRSSLKKSTSILALMFGFLTGHEVRAQPTPSGNPPGAAARTTENSNTEQIIVTGTRVSGMTAADSPEPVTVVSTDALINGQGGTDLREALSDILPSFNAQRFGTDLAHFNLSASLRGLSPNDTLIMVDGHRRHNTSSLHVVTANFASGSSAADLSFIPTAAIDHVEVLTDGAAAQYGSDAIAGVVNIITKKQSSGGLISGTLGQYYNNQGATMDLSANIGLPLFDKGYINITANKQTHDFTSLDGNDNRYLNAEGNPVPVGTVGTVPNAAGIIPCTGGNCIPTSGPYAITNDFGYPNPARNSGDSEYQLQMGTVQAGYNFTDDLKLYFEGTIGERTGKSHNTFRTPTQVIASLGSHLPCGASNLQGYNTAQTAGGAPACAIGVSNGTGVGVALLRGSVAATPGIDSSGVIISSGQAGTLFTPGELVMYPTGMQPLTQLREVDYQYNAGLNFKFLGFVFDADIGYGKDINQIETINTANRSLFIDTHTSPTNFYDGKFAGSQFTGTIDASRAFDVGLASPLTFAWGGEAREDEYGIGAGDPASYYKEGPQAFPGFSPTTAGNHSRKNYAGYVDFAISPVEELHVDVAGRFEHYTDFGNTETGKITARYDFSPAFAIRGTVSTGFRAPSIAEEFYSAVSVSAIAATVQLPADSAAAKVLGLPNLKPESSTQFSAGVVAHLLDNLFATVDVYSIALGNRILSSSTVNSSGGAINTPLVTQAITLEGVTLDPTATQQGVAAFLNGVSTLSQGVDVTVSYLSDFDEFGSVRWTLGANYNNTSISSIVPPPAVLLASNPNATFFNFQTLFNYVHSAPQDKVGLTADWNMGLWGATLRETYWGPQHSYVSPNGGGELIPFNQPDIGLTDMELRYSFTDDIQLAVGGENIFDIRPESLPYAPASCAGGGVIVITACSPGPDSPSGVALTASGGSGGRGPFGAPAFNPNGGYYYARIVYKL
jgi:iron complex outermembrane receptor protein